jgi:phage-related protein
MNANQREAAIMTVTHAKATNLFNKDIETYGSQAAALRALDCKTRDEAIAMLANVQTVKIFKQGGKVVLQ